MASGEPGPGQYHPFPPAPGAPAPPLAAVGGKGFSLIETSKGGLPVPPGVVLAVPFFEPWLDEIMRTSEWKAFVREEGGAAALEQGGDGGRRRREQCSAIRARCGSALRLNEGQEEALGLAVRAAFGRDAFLGPALGMLAVRSSSPDEDLAGSSFAGGYETTLGVTSATLEGALVASFSSMFDHRVVEYKSHRGMPVDAPTMAVVLQRQIDSSVSGVAFGCNPANNCLDEVAISANFGLGETVVGGTVTPDTYIVDRYGPEPTVASRAVAEKARAIRLAAGKGPGPEGGTREEENGDPSAQALADEQILEVAGLVARVEEHYGGSGGGDQVPMDIEWAYDEEGTLHLLQARPVTTYVPLFPEMLTERGAERRLYIDIIVLTQGFSDPLSVLGLDLWARMIRRIKTTLSTEGETGLAWHIHGRQYMNVSTLLKVTFGHALFDKAFRTMDQTLDRAVDTIDLNDYVPSEMPKGAVGFFWKQLAEIGKILPYLFWGMCRGDSALSDYIDGANALSARCRSDVGSNEALFGEVFESLSLELAGILPMVAGMASGLLSRARLHKMFLRYDAEDLLINLCMDLNGNPTSEMGHLMVRLASYPEVQNTDSGEEFVQKLKDDSFSTEFVQDYNRYLKEFGCRGMREIDVATPRQYEKQEDFFEMLKNIDVDNNQIKNVSEKRKKAYDELLAMAKELGCELQFKHHASRVQSLIGYREHPKFMLVVIVDKMRRHALKIGKEFVSQDRLQRVDQIFSLTVDQVTEAQQKKDLELLPLVDANIAPYRKVERIKEWPVVIDSRGKIIRGVRKDIEVKDGVLLGDPIAPGVVRGRAKVLNAPFEKTLKSGEIIVARCTEPSWTPLFINAGGVVMEIGGPMQHGAIIAREYGIPCVSGVENATKMISDGDLIDVDGSTGTVNIIESEDGVKL